MTNNIRKIVNDIPIKMRNTLMYNQIPTINVNFKVSSLFKKLSQL